MQGGDFVAVDFETANRNRASVCAWGVAVVRSGRVVQVDSRLVRPPRGLDEFEFMNVRVHGISKHRVRHQPAFEDTWEDLVGLLEGAKVIAHNAAFDIGVLRAGAEELGTDPPYIDYLCTMVVARQVLFLPTYRLPDVADHLGVSLRDHHDAASDARAAAQVALALMRRRKVRTIDALARDAGVSLGHVDARTASGCRVAR